MHVRHETRGAGEESATSKLSQRTRTYCYFGPSCLVTLTQNSKHGVMADLVPVPAKDHLCTHSVLLALLVLDMTDTS